MTFERRQCRHSGQRIQLLQRLTTRHRQCRYLRWMGLMEVSEESDAEKDGKFAKYVVADCKVRTGGRVSRLHLRKGCYLGRSLSFTSYELLYVDPPPARSYTDFCRRCWPKGRPKENLAELTSESNGDTTSSDTEDGADEIMQESIAELEEKKSP